MDAQLFDPGEPLADAPELPLHPRREQPAEQTQIAWEDVPPVLDTTGYPSDEAWVHAPDCKCKGCADERARLAIVRKAQYVARCLADRMTQAVRVSYYRARARRKLPLFERGPRELKK